MWGRGGGKRREDSGAWQSSTALCAPVRTPSPRLTGQACCWQRQLAEGVAWAAWPPHCRPGHPAQRCMRDHAQAHNPQCHGWHLAPTLAQLPPAGDVPYRPAADAHGGGFRPGLAGAALICIPHTHMHSRSQCQPPVCKYAAAHAHASVWGWCKRTCTCHMLPPAGAALAPAAPPGPPPPPHGHAASSTSSS